jgi:chromosome segregation ATPase
MAGELHSQAIGEILQWLEQQMRETRDDHLRTIAQLDQVRHKVYEMAEALTQTERAVREVDPKFLPFRGLPEKLRGLDETSEHLRHQVITNRSEMDNALRILRAEADYDREERAEALKRIEAAASQLGLLAADTAQLQAQVSQVSHTAASIIERQREVEARVEQFGLRLDRAIEVNKDVEERVKAVLTEDQEERYGLVYERLQVVGEMVKRNEALIEEATREQTMRREVIEAVQVWREQSTRVDSRVTMLEDLLEKLVQRVDKVEGEVALAQGRHTGLAERVTGIKSDIAQVVDYVREEFAKYNQMTEKQRRKQIQVLEQELREMKFHAFRPPEEP